MREQEETTPERTASAARDAEPEADGPATAAASVSATNQVSTGQMVRDLALYTVARVLLLVVIAAGLSALGVPLLVAAAVAVAVALPLSLVLFPRLRGRATAALAERGERRRAERDRLRAELRGARTPAEDAAENPASADGTAPDQDATPDRAAGTVQDTDSDEDTDSSESSASSDGALSSESSASQSWGDPEHGPSGSEGASRGS